MTAIKTTSIKSPIRFFGSKSNIAPKLISMMPETRAFCEVFGGGGNLISQKAPVPVEVYNDIDENLVNFLLILIEREKELAHALSSLPTSRLLFERWQKEPLTGLEPFERAVRWYYIQRQKIVPANNHGSGWRAGQIKNTAFDYQNSIKRFTDFKERFKNVMIECLDFREIIKRYSKESTFLFVDPPYRGYEQFYKGGFTDRDHVDLAALLNRTKSKVMVTYYPDPLIESLYYGWNRFEIDAIAGSGVTKKDLQQKKKRAVEVIYTNYDLPAVQSTLF